MPITTFYGGPMTRRPDKRTGLMEAVIRGDIERAERELSADADVNASDGEGWTALHFAAQRNEEALTALLLAHGASISALDAYGNNALFRAVFTFRGEADAIRVLLNAGADPDHTNQHGVSARTLANSIANYDARKFFVSHT